MALILLDRTKEEVVGALTQAFINSGDEEEEAAKKADIAIGAFGLLGISFKRSGRHIGAHGLWR